MDEVGRGTTVKDGLAIAFATVHHLYSQNRCRALFATHFHELTDMLGYSGDHMGEGVFENIGFYCTDVDEIEVYFSSVSYVHRNGSDIFAGRFIRLLPSTQTWCQQGQPWAQGCPAGRHAPLCDRRRKRRAFLVSHSWRGHCEHSTQATRTITSLTILCILTISNFFIHGL